MTSTARPVSCPEALLNFLGMLAWTRAAGEEKFALGAFVDHFELGSLSLAGAVFDTEKLAWLNGRYLREDYGPSELAGLLRNWRLDDETLAGIAQLAQPRNAHPRGLRAAGLPVLH